MNSPNIIKEKLIHKGAEANLYLGQWFNKKVIFKQRISKKYRVNKLDQIIRLKRTLNEGRALIRVKNYGVNVPQVYEIDTINFQLIMKHVEGKKLKNLLVMIDNDLKRKFLYKLGKFIAILHINGHIHGDITTSNVVITENNELFLIDFGLHEYSDTLEDKSVDLHLFKRVLLSSHGEDFQLCFNSFLDGYTKEYQKAGIKEYQGIIKNINVIETRGRYVKKEDRL
ncbi:MAG: KEOPS complex kinase/ATPase Bud32 [Candidatus Lokiarchaeota archaeon]